jgi:hypothetical protein
LARRALADQHFEMFRSRGTASRLAMQIRIFGSHAADKAYPQWHRASAPASALPLEHHRSRLAKRASRPVTEPPIWRVIEAPKGSPILKHSSQLVQFGTLTNRAALLRSRRSLAGRNYVDAPSLAEWST